MKHFNPKNVYELRETLFEKLEGFNLPVTEDNKHKLQPGLENIDLKQHLERYVNTLPVFGFNSGRYDLNLIKSYIIPYLINDKEQETSVIKKANNFISFKFEDVQFLDIMKILGGATTLDSFLNKEIMSKEMRRERWMV